MLAPLSLAVQATTYILPLISLTILFGAGVHAARRGLWRGNMSMTTMTIHHDQAAAYGPDMTMTATTTGEAAAGGLQYVDPHERQRQEYYCAAQQGGSVPVEMPHYGQQQQQQKSPYGMQAGWHEHHHQHVQVQTPPPPPGYEMDGQGRYGYGQVP